MRARIWCHIWSKFWPRMWHGLCFCPIVQKCLRTSTMPQICPGFGPGFVAGRGLRRNSKSSLQHVTKKQHIMFVDVQKHVVASLPRTSYFPPERRGVQESSKRVRKWCHYQAIFNCVSLDSLHLGSLFVQFTDTEEQNMRRFLASGTQVHRKNLNITGNRASCPASNIPSFLRNNRFVDRL